VQILKVAVIFDKGKGCSIEIIGKSIKTFKKKFANLSIEKLKGKS
jgi:hypothetical protein